MYTVAKKSNNIQGYIQECCQQVEVGDLAHLLSTSEPTSGVRCPAVGSPAHGHAAGDPVWEHKDD